MVPDSVRQPHIVVHTKCFIARELSTGVQPMNIFLRSLLPKKCSENYVNLILVKTSTSYLQRTSLSRLQGCSSCWFKQQCISSLDFSFRSSLPKRNLSSLTFQLIFVKYSSRVKPSLRYKCCVLVFLIIIYIIIINKKTSSKNEILNIFQFLVALRSYAYLPSGKLTTHALCV